MDKINSTKVLLFASVIIILLHLVLSFITNQIQPILEKHLSSNQISYNDIWERNNDKIEEIIM